ncbi:hypothetical protein MIR68_001002 [Amoeboaphelidium protococcarum]|nr:hypothetical protein MIR68_001002 [Amoeboaphelidium protococcarum]
MMLLLVPILLGVVQALSFHDLLSRHYSGWRLQNVINSLYSEDLALKTQCFTLLQYGVDFQPLQQQLAMQHQYQLDLSNVVKQQSSSMIANVIPFQQLVKCLDPLFTRDFSFEIRQYKWLDQDQIGSADDVTADSAYELLVAVFKDVLLPMHERDLDLKARYRLDMAVQSVIGAVSKPILFHKLIPIVVQLQKRSVLTTIINAMLLERQDITSSIIAATFGCAIRSNNIASARVIAKQYIHGNEAFEFQAVDKLVEYLATYIPTFDFNRLRDEIAALVMVNNLMPQSNQYGLTIDLINSQMTAHQIPQYVQSLFQEMLQNEQLQSNMLTLNQITNIVQLMTETDLIRYFDTLPYRWNLYAKLTQRLKLELINQLLVPGKFISNKQFLQLTFQTRLKILMDIQKGESDLIKAFEVVMQEQTSPWTAERIPVIDDYVDKLIPRYSDSNGVLLIEDVQQEHLVLDQLSKLQFVEEYLQLWAYHILIKRILFLYGSTQQHARQLDQEDEHKMLAEFVLDANAEYLFPQGDQMEIERVQPSTSDNYVSDTDHLLDPHQIQTDLEDFDVDLDSEEFAKVLKDIYK